MALPDIDLHLKACDVTTSAVNNLVKELALPVAGFILSTKAQHDSPFLKQTDQTFKIPFDAKIAAFKAVESVIRIEDLDFFVAISSLAIFGGQCLTNCAR